MAGLCVIKFDENTQFYGNEGHTQTQTHSIFYTSLAPSAESWDTSSEKSESQLRLLNLGKRLHLFVQARLLEGHQRRGEAAACVSPVTLSGHASWLPRHVTAVRFRQSRSNKKSRRE